MTHGNEVTSNEKRPSKLGLFPNKKQNYYLYKYNKYKEKYKSLKLDEPKIIDKYDSIFDEEFKKDIKVKTKKDESQ